MTHAGTGIAEPLLVGGFFLPFGLMFAFAGWQMHEALVAMFGALLGLIGGPVIAGLAGTRNLQALLVFAIIGGAVGAALALLLERLYVVLLGFVAGVGLTTALGVAAGWTTSPRPGSPIALVFGLLGGALAWYSYKGIIILVTAIIGGVWTSFATWFLFAALGVTNLHTLPTIDFVGLHLLLVSPAGALYQASGRFRSGIVGKKDVSKRISYQAFKGGWWAPVGYTIVLGLLLIPFTLPHTFAPPSPFPALIWAVVIAGPAVLATANTILGGSIPSSVVVGLLSGSWWLASSAVNWYTFNWDRVTRPKPPLAEFLTLEALHIFYALGLGSAILGILIGMVYSRIFGNK